MIRKTLFVSMLVWLAGAVFNFNDYMSALKREPAFPDKAAAVTYAAFWPLQVDLSEVTGKLGLPNLDLDLDWLSTLYLYLAASYVLSIPVMRKAISAEWYAKHK